MNFISWKCLTVCIVGGEPEAMAHFTTKFTNIKANVVQQDRYLPIWWPKCIKNTRLSKIFEQFNIRFASNFSNIKNTWFEHIQTLNFRIRFASLWTSNISNISNIFGKLFLAIIGLFLSLFFGDRSRQWLCKYYCWFTSIRQFMKTFVSND